jgi:decaprenylphospho-beta-D-erythro-pentofuranosid-2-ulose 2-reductase
MTNDTGGPGSHAPPRQTVLILGATSAIARAVAGEFARRGYDLLLAGRDGEELEAVAADLRLRYGVKTQGLIFDALAFDTHGAFVEDSRKASGDSLAGAVLCFGYLGDQSVAQKDPREAKRILDTNLLGAVSILSALANDFEEKRKGFLCALSSVAGERGRQSNYVYGAAKAGLTVFLQGLRNRLFASGVGVITIKPGFVDTQMTYGRPGMFLVASPEKVARAITKAVLQGRDEIYVPGFWRPVLFLIRSIPERIFKRMRL